MQVVDATHFLCYSQSLELQLNGRERGREVGRKGGREVGREGGREGGRGGEGRGREYIIKTAVSTLCR